MKIIVPISGGKDSQATLIYCGVKYGYKNIIAVFCDTKWEHQITYDHLEYLVKLTGVEYKILSSKKYDGFIELAKAKKRFPSTKVGFCTEELKIKPMIDYILALEESVLIFQGIRKDESIKRSKLNQECRFFKYYFEPYKSNELIVSYYEKNPAKSLVQKNQLQKAKDRLQEGKNDAKYHNYRKDDVKKWCANYSDDIHRPFFNATGNDVIYYCLNRSFDINPLYYKGASRVGCFPCKNARHDEIQLIMREFPEVIDKVRNGEEYTGSTFFSPNYIPQRYHTGIDPKSEKTICSIDDVVRYLSDKNVQIDLIKELGFEKSCKSIYAICE